MTPATIHVGKVQKLWKEIHNPDSSSIYRLIKSFESSQTACRERFLNCLNITCDRNHASEIHLQLKKHLLHKVSMKYLNICMHNSLLYSTQKAVSQKSLMLVLKWEQFPAAVFQPQVESLPRRVEDREDQLLKKCTWFRNYSVVFGSTVYTFSLVMNEKQSKSFC